MTKKSCITLIINILINPNQLIANSYMHNLYAIFAKFLDICKQFAGNLVNEHRNIPRCDIVPKSSDLEVIALGMASEAIGVDSEFLLPVKLREYKSEIPHLIPHRNTMTDESLRLFFVPPFEKR